MIDKKSHVTEQERAVLVGLITESQNEDQAKEYLEELDFLAHTARAKAIKHFTQKLPFANPKTFIGRGKLIEVKTFIKSHDVSLVIFDDELGPSQIRNIEKELECKILDRSTLILDIFASRARTALFSNASRTSTISISATTTEAYVDALGTTKGGIGMRGPGETQIETDRRIIQQKIALLKSKLVKIDKQKAIQRGNRGALVRVALVGYTNVGKSTIMNQLSKSDVFAENKLFATLDTTVRKVVIENLPFLLSDTVGFIRKLPHQLVESFKSTLDEVREADILLHVVDISHPNFEEQIDIVNKTLDEINASDKPTVMVFNKVDAFTYEKKEEDDLTPPTKSNVSLDEWKKTWMAKESKCVFISALQKDNFNQFRSLLYDMAKDIHAVRFPYNQFLY